MRCITFTSAPWINTGNFLSNIIKLLRNSNCEQSRNIFKTFNLSNEDIDLIVSGNACGERVGDDFCLILPGGDPGFPEIAIEPVNLALVDEIKRLVAVMEDKARSTFTTEEAINSAKDLLAGMKRMYP